MAEVFALKVAEVAGERAGIDPGRPGVPEFGRKLFRLGPRISSPQLVTIAVERKLRVAPDIGDLIRTNYDVVARRICQACACGVVLDYDGTLCDRRQRYEPLDERIGAALNSILTTGAIIGIATGRGQSAGLALEQIIEPEAWSRVLVGYYNGALISPLGLRPPKEVDEDSIAAKIGKRMRTWFPGARVEVRNWQVSADSFRFGRLPVIAHTTSRLLQEEGLPCYVVCSSHSIDVLLSARRKNDVVTAVRAVAGDSAAPVFRIGDRGLWPGNDFDLLDDPLGLSVDEVSRDPLHCWHLAPACP